LRRQLLAGFLKRLKSSPEGALGIIRGVTTRQAPAETFDKPAPRHPAVNREEIKEEREEK